jgi:hypothetical protein
MSEQIYLNMLLLTKVLRKEGGGRIRKTYLDRKRVIATRREREKERKVRGDRSKAKGREI